MVSWRGFGLTGTLDVPACPERFSALSNGGRPGLVDLALASASPATPLPASAAGAVIVTSTQLAGRTQRRPRAAQIAGGSAATCTFSGYSRTMSVAT